VRQVANELHMAPATVQRTYSELQSQGLLVGQTGRGVFVADLSVGVPPRTATMQRSLASERDAVLHGLLARAVLHTRSLGCREDEILATTRALAGGRRLDNGVAAPRVVFVGGHTDVVEKYRDLLSPALEDLGVQVETLLLDELERRGEAALDEHEPIGCLVSLVGTFADLRRLAGQRGCVLFGLVVDLTAETQQRLVELPQDVSIGLVAEERYMPSARAVMRQYLGSEEHLLYATGQMRSALKRIAGTCQIVVHTLGAKRLVEGMAAPGTELIELQFRPNPGSVARLRSVLTAENGRLAEGHRAAD
jgi:DNA-binding transcriptional regulator YhcF (GntR family)